MASHPNYTTPMILPDNPLSGEGKADFHFDEYAATFARLIADKKTETPLSIGISGSWGSGKTTLLRRIQGQLDGTCQLLKKNSGQKISLKFCNDSETPQHTFRVCRTVWFNAWKYQNEDALLVALVRVIVQEMFRDGFLSSLEATFWEPFTPRRDVINTVLGWASIKLPLLEVKTDTGEEKPTKLSEKTAILDLFDDCFDHLMAAWVHQKLNCKKIDPQKGVLVVFIDDLDRCLPAKAIQVLEAVKLFMDKTGCVFVLGADAEFIQRAVKVHYKEIEEQKAEDYLEKVIQLRFQLPQIVAEEIQHYLEAQKEKVNEKMLSRWQALVAAAEANPRRVKAVINDLELQWHMLENTQQASQVNRDDFICWQALMRSAPLNFREEFNGIPEDKGGVKLRHQFILGALRWICGSPEEQNKFRADYEKFNGKDARRMRDVLRVIGSFSRDFTPEVLKAFVHLAAPPPVSVVKASQGEEKEMSDSSARGQLREIWKEKIRTAAGMEFCVIPAGDFVMGSTDDNPLANDVEKPRHTVPISKEYWLARFPITNARFQAFVKANPRYRTTAEQKGSAYTYNGKSWEEVKGANWQHPYGPEGNLTGKEDRPAVCISWADANAFCDWLNQIFLFELPEGWRFRLPTEAEWERASRDVRGSAEWPWGDQEPNSELCNFEMNLRDTSPVGIYSPAGDSPYGCADMAGNVWEWTNTIFRPYPYNSKDGRESREEADGRVVRGGSFLDFRGDVRCAFRHWRAPFKGDANLGFRVVASPIRFDL